jgi:hypothetical protein
MCGQEDVGVRAKEDIQRATTQEQRDVAQGERVVMSALTMLAWAQ